MATNRRIVKANRAYRGYWNDETRTQIFFGGSSSGKSYFIAQRAVMDVLGGRNYLVCRAVARTIKGSVYNQIAKTIAELGLRDRFEMSRSALCITCRDNGRQILFAGLDDAEKLKSITPAAGVLTDIWIEEATEVTWNAYKQLTKRLRGSSVAGSVTGSVTGRDSEGQDSVGQDVSVAGRGGEGRGGLAAEPAAGRDGGGRDASVAGRGAPRDFKKRVTLSFNPVTRQHWIYKEFFGGWVEESRWAAGEPAPQDEGEGLAAAGHRPAERADGTGTRSIPGRVLRADDLLIVKTTYRDNRFLTADDVAALEGESDRYYRQVYTLGEWGVLGNLVFTNWRTEDLSGQRGWFDNLRAGLDFGFASDPDAFVRCHVDMKRRRIFVFEEMVACGLHDDELAEALAERLGGGYVTCDSADPKAISDLCRRGVRALAAVKGPDSVRFGIRFLQGFEIVVDPVCSGFVNEISTYQWAEDKYGNVLQRPVDRNNHLLDALRYAVEDLALRGRAEAGVRI